MASFEGIADIVTKMVESLDAKAHCKIFDCALQQLQTEADVAAHSKLWNVARVLALHRDYKQQTWDALAKQRQAPAELIELFHFAVGDRPTRHEQTTDHHIALCLNELQQNWGDTFWWELREQEVFFRPDSGKNFFEQLCIASRLCSLATFVTAIKPILAKPRKLNGKALSSTTNTTRPAQQADILEARTALEASFAQHEEPARKRLRSSKPTSSSGAFSPTTTARLAAPQNATPQCSRSSSVEVARAANTGPRLTSPLSELSPVPSSPLLPVPSSPLSQSAHTTNVGITLPDPHEGLSMARRDASEEAKMSQNHSSLASTNLDVHKNLRVDLQPGSMLRTTSIYNLMEALLAPGIIRLYDPGDIPATGLESWQPTRPTIEDSVRGVLACCCLSKHWVLYYMDLQMRTIISFNSVSLYPNPQTIDLVALQLTKAVSTHSDWDRLDAQAIFGNLPLQATSVDCGVFAVVFALRLGSGDRLRPIQFFIDEWQPAIAQPVDVDMLRYLFAQLLSPNQFHRPWLVSRGTYDLSTVPNRDQSYEDARNQAQQCEQSIHNLSMLRDGLHSFERTVIRLEATTRGRADEEQLRATALKTQYETIRSDVDGIRNFLPKDAMDSVKQHVQSLEKLQVRPHKQLLDVSQKKLLRTVQVLQNLGKLKQTIQDCLGQADIVVAGYQKSKLGAIERMQRGIAEIEERLGKCREELVAFNNSK